MTGPGPGRRRSDGCRVPAIGAFVVAAGVCLVALNSTGASAQSNDLRFGVSRVDGEPGIAIHWVLCDGEAAEVVDLEGHQGGSRPPNGVPVYWQIRAGRPSAGPARVETFVVGRTPDGYHETVPLRRALPRDLIVISGPPGGGVYSGGMSFEVDSLPRDSIHRGGYETVSPEAFARQGIESCVRPGSAFLQGAGLTLLGIGGALLATRRRPTALVILLALATTGVLEMGSAATGGSGVDEHAGGGVRQPAAAFASGHTPVPDGARVLAVISPDSTREVGDGFYVARINSPGPYSFAVSCLGPSMQIGEGAEIPNGETGARQLLGCATGAVVRGAIAERPDRSDLVEIVVDPNGSTDWRVTVVAATGTLGPFTEP